MACVGLVLRNSHVGGCPEIRKPKLLNARTVSLDIPMYFYRTNYPKLYHCGMHVIMKLNVPIRNAKS